MPDVVKEHSSRHGYIVAARPSVLVSVLVSVLLSLFVSLLVSPFVAELHLTRRPSGNGHGFEKNARLEASLAALVAEAKGVATSLGVFTEVGSRERIDEMERRAMREEDGGQGTSVDVELGQSSGSRVDRVRVCETNADCHHHGICDADGACQCVVAYAGVRCGKVVHVSFPSSSSFGRMLPLDVLEDRGLSDLGYGEEVDGAFEVSDRGTFAVGVETGPCVVETREEASLDVQNGAIGREIAKRLVERFGVGVEDGTAVVVGVLEAMRRCVVVAFRDDVEVTVGTTVGTMSRAHAIWRLMEMLKPLKPLKSV